MVNKDYHNDRFFFILSINLKDETAYNPRLVIIQVLNMNKIHYNIVSILDVSPAYAAALSSPVYESSFWTSKQVCETSHNHIYNYVSHNIM